MSNCIDKIKSKLVSAIDLDKKTIIKIKDVCDALKTLEDFPMTLDILNSSRMGKIVNEVRHFNETTSDIKNRLKDLIKSWNVKILPQKNKKTNRPNLNIHQNSIKVSESINNLNNLDNTVNSEFKKLYHSSNNLEIVNGNNSKYNSDCDKSINILNKLQKVDYTKSFSKNIPSKLTKAQQKENHFDDNYSLSNEKILKRKHESVSKHVVIKPLQKVKSTMELLANMGDMVGNDTKKKILCNEIVFEEDIQRSCIPESVRPRIKLSKTAQSIKISHKIIKKSPKIKNIDNSTFLYNPSQKINSTNFKNENKQANGFKSGKTQPFLTTEINKKISLKLKIALKQQKLKHIDPPVNNRMDDVPFLVSVDDLDLSSLSFDDYLVDREKIRLEYDENVAEKLAHHKWEGYNVTRHPTSGDLISLVTMYIVNGLYILPWTDTVYNSQVFFPLNEDLTQLSNSVTVFD